VKPGEGGGTCKREGVHNERRDRLGRNSGKKTNRRTAESFNGSFESTKKRRGNITKKSTWGQIGKRI